MPLGIAPIGETLKIAKIIVDEKVKKHLENLGILPGQTICVLSSNKGDLIVRVKNGKVALNRDLCMKIFISNI